jgi:hypothetical protein
MYRVTDEIATPIFTIGVDRIASLQAALLQDLPTGGQIERLVYAAVAMAPTTNSGACAHSVEMLAATCGTRPDRVYPALRSLHRAGMMRIRRAPCGRIREIRLPTFEGEPTKLLERIVARRKALDAGFLATVQDTVDKTATGRQFRLTGDLVIQWAAYLRADRDLTRAELARQLGLSERQCRALVPAEIRTDKRGKHVGLKVRKEQLFVRGSYPAIFGVKPNFAPPLFAAPTRARGHRLQLPAPPRRTTGQEVQQ